MNWEPNEPAGPSGPEDQAQPRPGAGGWDLLEGPPGHLPGGPPVGGLPDQSGATVPWSGRDIVAVLLLVVVAFFAAVLIITALLDVLVQAVPSLDRASFTESPVVITGLMVLQWVITLAVPLTYFKIRGYGLSAAILGFRRTAPGRAALWLLLVLILTSIFGQIYGAVIEQLFGPNELPSSVPSQDVTTLYGSSVLAIVLTFVAVALVTPVVEELFFRGIIHRGLEQSLGFLPGATLSSLIFALAHLDIRLYIPIFVLGFGLAFVVHKTGSIWTSIAGHFIINSLGVIAQFVDLGGGS